MMGDENYVSIFKQIFQLLMVDVLSLTKTDIDNMYPYERYGYFDMIKDYRAEQKQET
jgi:hypothetical protein